MGTVPIRQPFNHKHLLGISDLSRNDIYVILDMAENMREISHRRIKKVPTLRGLTIVNFFAEPSTRTRLSFEIAEKRMSADSVNISISGSSASKGETLLDTVKNIQAMKPDVFIVRHGNSGAPHMLARHVDASVINAGDGIHEHPTQALLDAFTIREAKGKLKGLRVLICGDIAHSRVAKSNALLLTRVGAKVSFYGPGTMIPPFAHEAFGADVAKGKMKDVVRNADVIMMLRIQKERQGAALYPSDREYSRIFGLSRDILAYAPEDALVMHPGPVNRGVELSPDVADDPNRSVILDQVENGVAVRMAVLYLLCGAPSIEE